MFNTQYNCFTVARPDVEAGGKVLMPESALQTLTRLDVTFPWQFKLSNKKANKTTHCGVLEFVADEPNMYIPRWMMKLLMMDEGGLIQVETASLPVASYAKFQAQTVDFLDLTNPQGVLEMRLRHFACLSTGDMIAINYNNKVYELNVLKTEPSPSVSIIDPCDVNYEFAPPVGDKVQVPQPMEEEEPTLDISELLPERKGFVAFGGSGNRLDGKKKRTNSEHEIQSKQLAEYTRGIPDYNFKIGNLKFIRNSKPKPKEDKEN